MVESRSLASSDGRGCCELLNGERVTVGFVVLFCGFVLWFVVRCFSWLFACPGQDLKRWRQQSLRPVAR